MANDTPAAIDATPDASRGGRKAWAPTPWKLWAVLLVLGIAGIAVTVSIPAYRRLQALRYFDAHHAKYELSPDDEWITERLGEWATGLRSVESIEIVIADEALIHVAAFQEVKELELVGHIINPVGSTPATISPHAAESLSRLRDLKSLTIIGSEFDDETICHLLDSQPLQSVTLAGSGDLRMALAELSQIPTIIELTFFQCEVDDDGFIGLKPLPCLKKFWIGTIGTHGLEWLAQCSALEELSIRHMTATSEAMQSIARMQRLRSLEIGIPEGLDAETLALLTSSPHLERLSLPFSVVNSDAFDVLEEMPHLNEVWVDAGSSQLRELVVLKARATTFEVKSYADGPFR